MPSIISRHSPECACSSSGSTTAGCVTPPCGTIREAGPGRVRDSVNLVTSGLSETV